MDRTNISNLILNLKGDRTYDQLAADCGGVPTAGRIQQMATKPQKVFPSPDSLKGLSRGLRVSPMVVLTAFATSLGLGGQEQSTLASLLPPEADNLTDGQVAAVLHVIQQMNPKAEGAGLATPTLVAGL